MKIDIGFACKTFQHYLPKSPDGSDCAPDLFKWLLSKCDPTTIDGLRQVGRGVEVSSTPRNFSKDIFLRNHVIDL